MESWSVAFFMDPNLEEHSNKRSLRKYFGTGSHSLLDLIPARAEIANQNLHIEHISLHL